MASPRTQGVLSLAVGLVAVLSCGCSRPENASRSLQGMASLDPGASPGPTDGSVSRASASADAARPAASGRPRQPRAGARGARQAELPKLAQRGQIANSAGQLGDGSFEPKPRPVAVLGLPEPASDLACAGWNSCARVQSGQWLCWGRNYEGQLGRGQVSKQAPYGSPSAAAVNGLGDEAERVELGGYRACALNRDGSAWCWGGNRNGSLGGAGSGDVLLPTQIALRGQWRSGRTTHPETHHRFVRHPGYLGIVLWALGTPLLLLSVWSLGAAFAASAWVVLRTALEDATLRRELPGYVDYCQRTRFRLVPKLW